MSAIRKVLVIGLDGATSTVIDPLLAAGQLPNLAKLMAEGTRAELHSTTPPNSAPAWTTFMTGRNPGKHGILDFKHANLRGSYAGFDGSFVNSGAFAGGTIFDLLGQAGRSVLAYRVPLTFPVWQIAGQMVAGYPTPDRKRAFTHPPELAAQLDPLALHSNDEIGNATPEEERRNADDEIAKLEGWFLNALRTGEHDFYMLVTGVPDGFHHKFWRFYDPTHPLYDPSAPTWVRSLIPDTYCRLDATVGKLLEATDGDWLVVVLSDHGGGPRAWRTFNTNAWLRSQGWLTASGGGKAQAGLAVKRTLDWAKTHLPGRAWAAQHLPQAVRSQVVQAKTMTGAIDWAHTQAYRLPLQWPSEGIVLNVTGRQPQGCVPAGAAAETLAEQIIARALAIRTAEGKSLFADAKRKAELYSGSHLDNLPDIVLTFQSPYGGGAELDALWGDVDRASLLKLSGDHTPDGVLFMRSPERVRSGMTLESAHLIDLPPTLLWALGLAVPNDMDGRVLSDAFTPDYLTAHPVHRTDARSNTPSGTTPDMSDEEEAEIRRALAGLGYVSE